jgi:diaminopimelate decarboxylase
MHRRADHRERAVLVPAGDHSPPWPLDRAQASHAAASAPIVDDSQTGRQLPERQVRRGCHGVPAVTARLEPWQVALCARPERLRALLEQYGSPLNIHHPGPFERNVARVRDVAAPRDVRLEILFARKADKALAYVDAARRLGIGVDTASEAELDQALDRGCRPELLVSTAAVKSERLLRTCLLAGVAIVLDNEDELDRVRRLAATTGGRANVMVRLGGFRVDGERLPTRFGFDVDEAPALGTRLASAELRELVRLVGLHFHLDGSAAPHRVAAITQSLPLIDAFRAQGHPVRSLHIGGGLPMSCVDDPAQWEAFQSALRGALRGEREPVTYRNRGLGLQVLDGCTTGRLATYPDHEEPAAASWLAQILDAPDPDGSGSLADALRDRDVTLRCAPGRSLLDGCGITIARVEHRKRHLDGTWSLGLAMNRTQCSTGTADHAVDPLLLPMATPGEDRSAPIEGFLTGASSTEGELLTWRRLRFPLGVARGDLVVFPNTAGYLMHSVESRSHQFPLATNVVVAADLHRFDVDPIDARWFDTVATQIG